MAPLQLALPTPRRAQLPPGALAHPSNTPERAPHDGGERAEHSGGAEHPLAAPARSTSMQRLALPSTVLAPHAPRPPHTPPRSPRAAPARPACSMDRWSALARKNPGAARWLGRGAARKGRGLAVGGTASGRISAATGSWASCLHEMERRDRPRAAPSSPSSPASCATAAASKLETTVKSLR